MRAWLREHEHAPGIRHGLGLLQRGWELTGRALGRDGAPALEGGWRARALPFPRPRHYTRATRRELARVARGQHTSYADGDTLERFEGALASTFDIPHAVAVSSGTAALHAAYLALGLGPGDEVLVPALSYVSCALALRWVGAEPVFVDVDPATWTLDPTAAEAAVGPRTRAVLAVHLCGVPADLGRLEALCTRHGLTLIEDAAQASGATWQGRAVGTVGALGCFSFQSTKSLVTGEGGAVLTRDDALATRVRLAMHLGEQAADERPTYGAPFDPTEELTYAPFGLNYRLGALPAALGLGQLGDWPVTCAARRRNAARLSEGLTGVAGMRPQACPTDADPCRTSFFLSIEGGRRDEVARALAHERIDRRLPYACTLPATLGIERPFPHAERVCAEALGLRVDPALGVRDMERTAFALRRLQG